MTTMTHNKQAFCQDWVASKFPSHQSAHLRSTFPSIESQIINLMLLKPKWMYHASNMVAALDVCQDHDLGYLGHEIKWT